MVSNSNIGPVTKSEVNAALRSFRSGATAQTIRYEIGASRELRPGLVTNAFVDLRKIQTYLKYLVDNKRAVRLVEGVQSPIYLAVN